MALPVPVSVLQGVPLQMATPRKSATEPLHVISQPDSILERYDATRYGIMEAPECKPWPGIRTPCWEGGEKPWFDHSIGTVTLKNGISANEGDGSVIFPGRHGNSRVMEAYRQVGLSIHTHKAEVMRALSSHFERSEMKRVFSTVQARTPIPAG